MTSKTTTSRRAMVRSGRLVRRWWPLAAWSTVAVAWFVWCCVDGLAGMFAPVVAALALPSSFACAPNNSLTVGGTPYRAGTGSAGG